MSIGCKIEGLIQIGNVVVQTPAYLTPGLFNVIDEYQFLNPHSLLPLSNSAMWDELLLMSATPF